MAQEKFYQDKISNFPYKNVAVIGMGKSGLAALGLLDYLGINNLAINQGEVETWRGSVLNAYELKQTIFISQTDESIKNKLLDCDLVILSPGIPRDIEILTGLEIPIWCEVELAYYFCENRSKIVSVTGTNGKTTTVSLLEACLEQAQIPYFVGGNIGTPFCEYIFELLTDQRPEAEVIALELSSFQLESMFNFHSHISCILNITFSHGERYNDITPYALAKLRIFNNQTDADFSFVDKQVATTYNLSKQTSLDLEDVESLKNELAKILDFKKVKIVGVHNIKNIFFVYKIWKSLNLSLDIFINSCYSFNGVHYRLERLGEFFHYEVFNDSKSTNWEATQTALNGVLDRGLITLVLSGQKRGHGDERIEVIRPYYKYIKHIYLIGESGVKLSELLKNEISSSYVENFSNLKIEIQKNTHPGVLLFSPAFPSFDQFKSYVDRGEKFFELFN